MKAINKRLFILTIVTLSSIPSCQSQDKNKIDKTVTVTYIANEGFLIETGDKTILIDALFGDKEKSYCDTPDSAQIRAMIKAKGIYKNIDMVAVTHEHSDHFWAPFVSEHLKNNEKGKLISCNQVINNLAESDNYEEFKDKLVEITPDSLTFIDTVINGIGVRVYRLNHGPYYVTDPETGKKINKHQNIQNLGFLFNINGIRIFHCGDSDNKSRTDYGHFRLDQENIDIAFLGRGFLWCANCKGTQIVREFIKPEQIVLMHLQPGNEERLINVASELKDEFPSVTVFENRMETRTYTIK